MKERNKRGRKLVRLVVSKQSLALGGTETQILTMWLPTNGVVNLCGDSMSMEFLFINNKLTLTSRQKQPAASAHNLFKLTNVETIMCCLISF